MKNILERRLFIIKFCVVLPDGYEKMRVKDLWRSGSGGDFTNILPYIPEKVKLQIMIVVLDEITGATDRISWGDNENGSFTVKSAYACLTRNNAPKHSMGNFFDKIWQVKAPEWVHLFIWLVSH